MKRTILSLKNSVNRSPLRLGFLLNALVLAVAWLAPWQLANAQCPQICDGAGNTAIGDFALNMNTGFSNTATGNFVLSSGNTGSENTATGTGALTFNTSGGSNTAIGAVALESNTTGGNNTATGAGALQFNTTGSENTASGFEALQSNTSGILNTAVGVFALMFNTSGSYNVAVGSSALEKNTIGNLNTAIGDEALVSNTTGTQNMASGNFALFSNTTGDNNTAIGASTLNFNTVGSNNTALGDDALRITTGSYNIGLGFKAGYYLTTGNRNIDIGNPGVAHESTTIRIGTVGDQTATFIAGISGATVPTGVPVIVDNSGHLGTTTSSARFKDEIKPMDKASEAILALKPVTFRYKRELDPKGIPQFGLVAEEVEQVNPDLVARDEQGKPYTVRYEAVNAMLLNEFLKEHRKVVKQEATIAELKAELRATATKQQKQIEALTASLQKVSAQLEASRFAPQMVVTGD